MATKRINNPKTHTDMSEVKVSKPIKAYHINERDSEKYIKGQITGGYKTKK